MAAPSVLFVNRRALVARGMQSVSTASHTATRELCSIVTAAIAPSPLAAEVKQATVCRPGVELHSDARPTEGRTRSEP